jgi:hypothetical protein
MNNTYYDILGIPHNATNFQIQMAYTKMIQKSPLYQQSKLTKIYHTLINPMTRKQYDDQMNNKNNTIDVFSQINQSASLFDQIFKQVEQIASRIDTNKVHMHVLNIANTPEFQQFTEHIVTEVFNVPSSPQIKHIPKKSSVIIEELNDDENDNKKNIPLLLEAPNNNEEWKIKKDKNGCIVGMINDDILLDLIKK